MEHKPPPAPPPHWIVPTPAFNERREYRTEDYAGMLDGDQVLPNFKPVPIDEAAYMAVLSYARLHRGRAKLPDSEMTRKSWSSALFVLNATQGGSWDGTGTVIVERGWSHADQRYTVVSGTFAICEHEKKEDPGANHQRGWHPGHCCKCGMNMNVDSGD